jgi:superfamily I DNA/RNA helicase/DNA polymerase III epsilon subunit-like protein
MKKTQVGINGSSVVKNNVTELKKYLKQSNMVSGTDKYKKEKLVTIVESMKTYFETINGDYRNYKLKDDRIMTVNDEQYEVIMSNPSNNIRIIACAGSGKTTTIICRIKYLIDKGVLPSKIILMTFNVDAAKSMKNKLKEIFCGFKPNVLVGTIDSVACKFYHTYFKKEYQVGVQEYCAELLNFLKSPSGQGSLITSKYDYLFVDEFQDVNKIQYETILEFYKAGTKITVIGDDAQNIYKFRGSDMKYIIELDKHIKYLNTYTLRINYRSYPEVIHLANKSISYNKNQIPKQMLSNKPASNILPELECFNNFSQLGNKIIAMILTMINPLLEKKEHDLVKQKTVVVPTVYEMMSLNDICIISRNINPLKKMEELIEQHNKRNPDKKIQYVTLIDNDKGDTKSKIRPGFLTLTTIHKSKGLEWNSVFLIGCCDDSFPNKKDYLSMEEERRLFYVAVTRAKKHLYFYFNKMANATALTYVSRFIQEVPSISYKYLTGDQSIFGLSTFDKTFYDTDIFKLIKSFREEDFEQLRSMKMFENLDPVTTIVHESTELNKRMYDDSLCGDFSDFLSRYGARYVQSWYVDGSMGVKDNKIFDKYGFYVTRPCVLNNFEYLIYTKNKGFLTYTLKSIKFLKNKNTNIDIQSIMNKYVSLVPAAGETEIAAIKEIINKAISIGTCFNIKLKHVYFCNESILPEEFRKQMKKSYVKYDSGESDNENILNDVYNISLCQNIYGNRKRLLYRDDLFELFTQDTGNVRENIKKALCNLVTQQVKTDKLIKVKKYEMEATVDYVDTHCITLMRLSNTDNFNLLWLLQIIGVVSLIEYNKRNKLEPNKINKYANFSTTTANVYNPLRGLVFTVNLEEWVLNYEKSKYFIEYMDFVRARQNNGALVMKPINFDGNRNSVMQSSPLPQNNNIQSQPEPQPQNNNGIAHDDDEDNFTDTNNDLVEMVIKGVSKDISGNTEMIDRFVEELSNNNQNKIPSYDHKLAVINMYYDKYYRIGDYTIMNKITKLKNNYKYLIVDTETNGIPLRLGFNSYYNYKNIDKYNVARIVQISWVVCGNNDVIIEDHDYIIQPNGFKIDNSRIHGITEEIARTKGRMIRSILEIFTKSAATVDYIVCHNVNFDINVIKSEMFRLGRQDMINVLEKKLLICTLETANNRIKKLGHYHSSKLENLYEYLTGNEMHGAHNSKFDVAATKEVFCGMVNRGYLLLPKLNL